MECRHLHGRSAWKPSGWCKGKNILLIGGGDSVTKFKNQIVNFIKIKKPIVLSINIQKSLNKNYINGYIAANRARTLMDSMEYSKSSKYIYASRDALINIANIKDYILSPAKIQKICFKHDNVNECINEIILESQ
jgi:hypothetical protein